jgi:hypothetical protein
MSQIIYFNNFTILSLFFCVHMLKPMGNSTLNIFMIVLWMVLFHVFYSHVLLGHESHYNCYCHMSTRLEMFHYHTGIYIYIYYYYCSHGRDCMVVGYTTTLAISAFHHLKYSMQLYVIKFISDLRFLRFPPLLWFFWTIGTILMQCLKMFICIGCKTGERHGWTSPWTQFFSLIHINIIF